MSGSRWVITPLWLSWSWGYFLYSSSIYSCYLFLISLLLLVTRAVKINITMRYHFTVTRLTKIKNQMTKLMGNQNPQILQLLWESLVLLSNVYRGSHLTQQFHSCNIPKRNENMSKKKYMSVNMPIWLVIAQSGNNPNVHQWMNG